jgi:putative FmdB family regulatory protein
MPIYEYRCQDCQSRFEKLVRRAEDASELVCPRCGQKRLALELSTFAAHTGGSRQPAPACPSAGACPNAGLCGMN